MIAKYTQNYKLMTLKIYTCMNSFISSTRLTKNFYEPYIAFSNSPYIFLSPNSTVPSIFVINPSSESQKRISWKFPLLLN